MSAVAELPPDRYATAPPETRGIARDAVRMLVASAAEGLTHRRAFHLPAVLRPGDLVVVNTSDTLPAALRGVTETGEAVLVHLSTPDPAAGMDPASALRANRSDWVVEVRRPTDRQGGEPSFTERAGVTVRLGGARLTVRSAFRPGARRLWTAELVTPTPLRTWLSGNGQPIRYAYVSAPWPLSAYRTSVADTPGGAEMPSAARPLTERTFRRLRARGVRTAGLVLHCGVSSPEAGEPPYAEWFTVPPSTVEAIAETRAAGGRVIAVGTTVVRALETVARTGRTAGWTDLVVTPAAPVSAVDALLTGWHEPAASHLQLLSAVAGPELLRDSYAAAIDGGYRWHEFGDVHLILP